MQGSSEPARLEPGGSGQRPMDQGSLPPPVDLAEFPLSEGFISYVLILIYLMQTDSPSSAMLVPKRKGLLFLIR